MKNIPKNIKINIIDNENSNEVMTKYVKVGDKENPNNDAIIHEINLAAIRKKYDNDEELSKFEKMLLMIGINEKNKLVEIAEDDEDLLRIKEVREKLSKDEKVISEFLEEQEDRDIYMAGYARARMEMKAEKNIILAKKLLDNNIDTKLITDFTGLDEKELEALK